MIQGKETDDVLYRAQVNLVRQVDSNLDLWVDLTEVEERIIQGRFRTRPPIPLSTLLANFSLTKNQCTNKLYSALRKYSQAQTAYNRKFHPFG